MVRLANLLLILLLIIALTPLKATRADSTLVVTALDDEDGNGPDCSLREAIIAVSTAQDYGGCTHTSFPVSITFDSTVFASDHTITLNSALPDLGGSITIDGGTAGRISISGNHLSSRIFTIAGGAAVTLQNLTLRDSNGGAVYNSGTLMLRSVTVTGNSGGGGGGGLNNAGTTVVVNSTISGNITANSGGVANTGTLTLVNSSITNNSTGGILNAGTLTLYNTIVANNKMPLIPGSDCSTQGNAVTTAYNSLVKDGGCGVTSGVNGNLTGDPLLNGLADNGGPTQTYLPQPSSPVINAGDNSYLSEATLNLDLNGDGDTADTLDTDQRGAGYARVRVGTVDMGSVEAPAPFAGLVVDTTSDANLKDCSAEADDCSLRGAINLANQMGGTVTFDSTVFALPQVITLSNPLPDLTGTLMIDGGTAGHVTISGNHFDNRIFTIAVGAVVTLQNLTLRDGGAGAVYNDGTLTIHTVTVTQNGNGATYGGGIFNNNLLWVLNSIVNGNSSGEGGGLYNSQTAIVVNSTLSNNSASAYGGGGSNKGTLTLVNSTVTNNWAGLRGGGLYDEATLTLYNSIVANNLMSGIEVDCWVSPYSNGVGTAYNSLIEDGRCGAANGANGNLNGDPLLDPLYDNGGPTQTYLPLATSPVINAGDNSYLSEATLNLDLNGDGDTADTLDADQRGAGFVRVIGAAVDMGAVETVPSPVVDTTSDSDLQSCSDLPNDCSLRGAINFANANPGKQIIMFDSSVFSTPQTITLSNRLPDITTRMDIVGPGANLLTISGNQQVRPFYINFAGDVTISGVTITQGFADYGGAINLNYGALTLQSVVVSSSHATQRGGGVQNANGSNPASSGTLRVVNSTFSGNVADRQGGAIASLGTIIASNSTFSSNHASKGGAIYSDNPGSVELVSVTVSGNTASSAGGVYAGAGTLVMRNTILANSTGGDCVGAGSSAINYSLIESGGCGIANGQFGNQTGDPSLNPAGLQDNGGPTPTITLLPSSKAINAGDNNSLSENTLQIDLNGDGDMSDILAADQRGENYTRILSTAVDLGALESLPNDGPPINHTTANVVTLTWSKLSWATGYEVQVSLDKSFTQLKCVNPPLQPGNNLSVDTCWLDSGTYYWRVRGKSASQANTTWSTPDTFVIAVP
jgi:CSLREA domain-containing protein